MPQRSNHLLITVNLPTISISAYCRARTADVGLQKYIDVPDTSMICNRDVFRTR